MSSVIQTFSSTDTQYLPSEALEQSYWYAIHTRAQHEKRVDARLHECGISTFLPLVKQVHRWSDRRKVLDLPLFSCYVFVNIVPSPKLRLTVLRAEGVIGFVGDRGQGTPVRDAEIECVRLLLSQNVPFVEYPFLKVGQRVRIRGGPLDGVEGILAADCNRKLVISVEVLQRSIAVMLDGYDVEPRG